MASIPVEFDKSRMQKMLRELQGGTASPVADTMHDLLAMSGACLMLASRHVPQMLQDRGLDWSSLPLEHKEMKGGQIVDNMMSALTYYSHLCRMLKEGVYDEEFESYHSAVVFRQHEKMKVIPVSGVRRKDSAPGSESS